MYVVTSRKYTCFNKTTPVCKCVFFPVPFCDTFLIGTKILTGFLC